MMPQNAPYVVSWLGLAIERDLKWYKLCVVGDVNIVLSEFVKFFLERWSVAAPLIEFDLWVCDL